MNINQKTVLVTGGGSGIGLSIAKAFLSEGAYVIICGRNEEKLMKAKAANPKLVTAVCDVTNDQQIADLVGTLKQKNGGVDILINNAGVFQSINYLKPDQSLEMQAKEIEIDLMGPIRMVNHFLPSLKMKNESAIVNVSSGLAFVPLAVAPVYSATKAGLNAWTRSLRYQLQQTNVKIFELMPPLVKTEMVSDFEGQKMMDSDVLASHLIKGMKSDKYQITPGQSKQLRMMSRMAPNFIFKAVNKQFA